MKDEAFDLVLTGLQSDDQGFAQTGVILAERLGFSHATIIMEVQADGGALRVKRELEGGWFQWVTLPMPARAHDSERHQPAPLCDAEGHHGGEEERDSHRPRPVRLPLEHQQILSLYVPEKSKKTQLIEGSPADAPRISWLHICAMTRG